MNIEELWKYHGIPILFISVLMYFNYKLGVFKIETYKQRNTRQKKEVMEMISNYMKHVNNSVIFAKPCPKHTLNIQSIP